MVSSEAPTVVFMHGFNFFTEMYAPFINKLVQSYNVVTFDFPGHGLSDFEDKYPLSVFTQALEEIV